jgi:rSAM/selenodomain-associated transferase 2
VLSIIIPTLDAGGTLGSTLASLAVGRERLASEILVVDGGSVDDTREQAAAAGAIVVRWRHGRGGQLAEGAAAAAGDWLLFLHGDTRLDTGWPDAVAAFMASPDGRRRAAFFRFALDDGARAARWLEAAVLWRNRLVGLPYGDQGLLIERRFYESLGGYRRLPLMEDIDLARRIGRRRLAMLPVTALTSAERYRRDGYVVRPLRNALCLGLYAAGVPPRYIAPLY